MELCLIGICNIIIIRYGSSHTDKEYLVDISRAAQEMREGTLAKDLDIGKYYSTRINEENHSDSLGSRILRVVGELLPRP